MAGSIDGHSHRACLWLVSSLKTKSRACMIGMVKESMTGLETVWPKDSGVFGQNLVPKGLGEVPQVDPIALTNENCVMTYARTMCA